MADKNFTVKNGLTLGGPIVANNSVGVSDQVLKTSETGVYWTQGNIFKQGLIENSANITSNYTITTGYNAMSAGPITVANSVIITVPSGSVWTVV